VNPSSLKLQAKGQEVPRDAFGHVKLDAVNPGKWFGEQFAQDARCGKNIGTKIGYFARASASNVEDIRLIKSCADLAVECALRRESGLIGHDETVAAFLRAIEFPRIKGGKPLTSIRRGSIKPLLKLVRPRVARLR